MCVSTINKSGASRVTLPGPRGGSSTSRVCASHRAALSSGFCLARALLIARMFAWLVSALSPWLCLARALLIARVFASHRAALSSRFCLARDRVILSAPEELPTLGTLLSTQFAILKVSYRPLANIQSRSRLLDR